MSRSLITYVQNGIENGINAEMKSQKRGCEQRERHCIQTKAVLPCQTGDFSVEEADQETGLKGGLELQNAIGMLLRSSENAQCCPNVSSMLSVAKENFEPLSPREVDIPKFGETKLY